MTRRGRVRNFLYILLDCYSLLFLFLFRFSFPPFPNSAELRYIHGDIICEWISLPIIILLASGFASSVSMQFAHNILRVTSAFIIRPIQPRRPKPNDKRPTERCPNSPGCTRLKSPVSSPILIARRSRICQCTPAISQCNYIVRSPEGLCVHIRKAHPELHRPRGRQ